jgi:hypothetical protein
VLARFDSYRGKYVLNCHKLEGERRRHPGESRRFVSFQDILDLKERP